MSPTPRSEGPERDAVGRDSSAAVGRPDRQGRLSAFLRDNHVIEHAITIALRGAAAAGKFALSLYIIAYIGLAELGVYGLLVAAATSASVMLSFGLGDWTTRQMMGLPRLEAMPLAATRLMFSIAVQCVVQPIFWVTNGLLGEPIPSEYAVVVAFILLFEHLGTDTHGPLIARGRVLLAAVNLFLRAGLWPFAIIAVGVVVPEARSLFWILVAWLAGLTISMVVLVLTTLTGDRWREVRFRWTWLKGALKRCWPFYVSDIGLVGSLYADRFIISLFIGLELTGVYVFFWSAANVVHSIAVYGTFHPRVPSLVEAVKAADTELFRKRLLQSQTATMIWAMALSVMLWIAVDLFVLVADKPLMLAYFGLFAWVIGAMLIRVLGDGYHWVLYALHRDRMIAAVNLGGAVVSAGLNLVMVATFGLAGAVAAAIVTGLGLLAARFVLARPATRAVAPAIADDRSGRTLPA